MEENDLLKRLKRINSELIICRKNENEIGILSGLSGIILFQHYYARLVNDDAINEVGIETINLVINKINNGYNNPTYCSGICGFAWCMEHLKQNDFLIFDIEPFLIELDEYLYSNMIIEAGNKNFDFFYGSVGYCFYFFKRYKNTSSHKLKSKYKKYILEFISILCKFSIKKKGYVFWESVLVKEKSIYGCNLGLSHGISSIIHLLSGLSVFVEFKKETEELLKGSIKYFLKIKTKNGYSCFPNWIEKGQKIKYNSRLAWCYGDLGIGLTLFNASSLIKEKKIKNISIEILTHSTKRKTKEESLISEAGLCHGAFGNSLIFSNIFKKTNLEIMKTSSDYWFEKAKGLSYNIKKSTGYMTWNESQNDWKDDFSLLEGITGMGLAMISHLSKNNLNWDECLMIK